MRPLYVLRSGAKQAAVLPITSTFPLFFYSQKVQSLPWAGQTAFRVPLGDAEGSEEPFPTSDRLPVPLQGPGWRNGPQGRRQDVPRSSADALGQAQVTVASWHCLTQASGHTALRGGIWTIY